MVMQAKLCSLACYTPLTSCCAAQFLTSHRWYQSTAQGLGTPGIEDKAGSLLWWEKNRGF